MRNKIFLISLFIISSIFLYSCKKNNSQNILDLEGRETQYIKLDKDLEEMSTDEAFSYLKSKAKEFQKDPEDIIDIVDAPVKTIKGKDTGIYSASGICSLEDYFLVLDSENSNISVLDKDGKVIKKVGKLGSGDMEFKAPSAICYNETLDKIYVYDSANKRIVKLNTNLTLAENINIEFPVDDRGLSVSSGSHLGSLVVDDDENYYFLPLKSGSVDTARLLKFQNSKQVKKYDGVVVGNVKLTDGRILIVETDQIFNFGELIFPNTGNNRLFELKEDKIIKLGDFPYGYRPEDVELVGNRLFAYSSSWLTLDEFDLDNNLKHVRTLTPQIIPEIPRERGFGRHASMTRIDDKIVICDRFTGNIYIVDINQ